MQVIAHRGNSHNNKDNSIESIKSALQLNVDMIEIDIRITKDNQIVVFHDNSTNSKLIEDMTYMECIDCNIISLSEILNTVNNQCKLYLDIKMPILYNNTKKTVFINKLFETIKKSTHNFTHILFCSYDHNLVNDLNNTLTTKGVCTSYGYILSANITNYEILKKSNCNVVVLDINILNKKLIDYLNNENIKIYVFTINFPKLIRKLQKYQIHGLISDNPKLVLDTLYQ